MFRPQLEVFEKENCYVLPYRDCVKDLEAFLAKQNVSFQRPESEEKLGVFKLTFLDLPADKAREVMKSWQSQ